MVIASKARSSPIPLSLMRVCVWALRDRASAR